MEVAKKIIPILIISLICIWGCSQNINNNQENVDDNDDWSIFQILQKDGFENATTDIIRKNGRIISLTIKGGDITKLPFELTQLDSLKALYLSNNQIKEIEVLPELTSLVDLNLSNNQIDKFPEIKKLNKLTFLILDSNQLSGTFDCEKLPKSLKIFSFSDNKVLELKSLSNLNRLSYLSFGRNQVEQFPRGICELPSLSKIEMIGNPIQDEKIDIMCLNNLNFLYIDSVHLNKLKVPEDTKVIY